MKNFSKIATLALSTIIALNAVACSDDGDEQVEASSTGTAGTAGTGGTGGNGNCGEGTKLENGVCVSICGSGTHWDGAACVTNTSNNGCTSTSCGSGTYCGGDGLCHPNTGGTGGSNNGCTSTSCGSGTYCGGDGLCHPNTGGTGGTGGSSNNTWGAVTWRNWNSGSGNGWVDVSNGNDGSYTLNQTAPFSSSQCSASGCAVCNVMYGSGTTMTTQGNQGSEWWSMSKSFLGSQTGHASGADWFKTQEASKAAAALVLQYRAVSPGSRPSNWAYWRAAGVESNFVQNEAVPSTASGIECSFTPASGQSLESYAAYKYGVDVNDTIVVINGVEHIKVNSAPVEDIYGE